MMSMSLRRTIINNHRTCCWSLLKQQQQQQQQSRSFTVICSSHTSVVSPAIKPTLPQIDLSFTPPSPFWDFRRGFAKARKSKDDNNDQVVEEDIGPAVKSTAISQMEAAVDALSRELAKLRTGRANTGMLDHIIVETRGAKMNLNRLAIVTTMDPKTLAITPYDPETIKAVEKAIVSSPLGLNPTSDGQRLLAAIPPLTKEHIKTINKIVSKSSEDVKQSIRRARQKALDTIKKAGYPKDSAKRLEKEIDEVTKKFVKSAEDMCKAKEKEISAG